MFILRVCVSEKLKADMRPVLRKRQSGEQDTAQGQETGDRRQGAGGCFAAAATDRKTTIVVQVARGEV